jgi:uncharacterized membrane protein
MSLGKTERGSSLAWTAVFLTSLLLPLMLLGVDGARLFYVRGRLQTATDAACEDAAWLAGDRRKYLESGLSQFGDLQNALGQAQSTFTSTLNERDRMAFSAALSITLNDPFDLVLCTAMASVPVLFTGSGRALMVSVPASAVSAIRFR